MTYIDYLNGFNQWLEQADSPTDKAIILYYGLLNTFNRRGWPRWAGVDTQQLMMLVRVTNKPTAFRARDALVEAGLIEYKPGRKGKASEYRLLKFGNIKRTENATENVTRNVTQNVTEDATENVTRNVTQNVTEDVTKNVTENVTPNKTKIKDEDKLLTTTTRTCDEGLGRVMSAFLDKINPTPSQDSIDLLKGFCEEMGAEVCLAAIDKALDAGSDKRNCNYIRGTLRSLSRQGVKCLADWKKLDEDWRKSKTYGPDGPKPRYKSKVPYGSAGQGPLGEFEQAALDRMLERVKEGDAT